MLLGGDLWFFVRVVVAGFTVLFVPLSGLVLRQRWLRSAARNEEIKRLLVLASEETARAELEANHEYGYGGYSYSQGEPEPEPEPEQEVNGEADVQAEVEVHLTDASSAHRRTQNECEVCSSPTTNRCARCKRVYYCSGKCQIIHWRQGHKDECSPFGSGDQKNDVGGCPHPNPLIPPKNGSYTISNGVGVRHPVKPVETNTKEYAFSDSNIVKSLDGNDDNEIAHLKEERGRNPKFVAQTVSDELPGVTSISKSKVNVSAIDVNNRNVSGRHQFVHKDPVEFEANRSRTDRIKPASPEDSHLLSSGGRASAFKHNLGKPSLHVNSQCGSSSSSSSGSSVDECNESSFSEPSTPSSGFWEGMNNFPGGRSDVLDDTPHSCFNEKVDIDASDFHLSPSYHVSTGNLLPCISGPDSHVRKSEDVPPAISGIKEPTDGLASSVEINNFVMESQRVSMSERSGHADDVDINRKEIAAPVKSKQFDCGNDAKASSPPVKSKCEVAPKCNNTFTEPKPVEVKSLLCKASVLHLSSGNAKQTTENVKSAKAERTHMTSACKSDFHSQQKDRISSKASVWKVVDQLKAPKLARLNPLGIPSEGVGRYCDKGLFQYDLFVKLYNWNKVELVPCGLMNCGNSCYANAVLQCLAFTPPLTAYFLQGLHSRSCKKRGWCFTCEFERLVLKAKEGHSPISPSLIISQLQHIGSHLGNGKEEDAHEFLRYAIDAMQSICLKEAGVSASSSLEETTLIGLTFGGYLRSKIECMKCGGKSERHEKMMDLTVEIEGDIGTLEEALRQFTRSETLDGENKYLCGRCKSFEKARKKLRVLEAPNVLTIALKRFQSGKFGKLNKTIKFPEILNMAPYISGTSDKSPVYRLYGVVVHLDIMNAAYSGHYICYVKDSQNRWFKIDDSTVKEVELERVLTKDAYMLLYARCSPRAPRLLRSPINPRDSRKANDTDCKSRYPSCHPWDQSLSNLVGSSRCNERSYLCRGSVQPTGLEDDSSCDNSSSFFSEVNSCSTDSSTRDSTSTDYYDQMFGDMGAYWNGSWRNSSDSETLSSTSSPSPIYLRRSSYADLDHFASRYSETSVPSIDAAESAVVGKPRHPGSHQLEAEGNGSVSFLCSDSTKQRRNLGCSSSNSRESGSRKSGWANSLDNLKSSVTFRRSSRERPG